jgi:hypothetical protein
MADSTQRQYPWWEFFIPGVILLLGSIYVWWYFGELEKRPDVHRLPAAIAALYNLGGKWGVTIFVGAVGAILTTIGSYKFITKLKQHVASDS